MIKENRDTKIQTVLSPKYWVKDDMCMPTRAMLGPMWPEVKAWMESKGWTLIDTLKKARQKRSVQL